jgi:hypothetical protein
MKNSQKLINRIEKNGTKPKPKWVFILSDILLWALYAISILLGGISFSVILLAFGESDMGLKYMFQILPIIWVITIFLFFGLAYVGIKKTKRGYKYRIHWLISANLLASIVIGAVVHLAGLSASFERGFAHEFSGYHGIEERKVELWSQPENGYLAGTVMDNTDQLIINDLGGIEWQVDITHAQIRGRASINTGAMIKIIGQKSAEYQFVADEIRPWEGRGMQSGRKL